MSKKSIFLSICFFISCVVFSQKKSFDIIENTIKKNDSISRIKGDFDENIKLNIDTYYLSKKNNFKKGEILSLINVANGLWNKGDNKSSIKILNKLEKDVFLKEDDKLYLRVLQELGQAYLNLKLYDIALDYHHKVEKLAKNNPDLKLEEKKTMLTYSYGSIAFIHEQNKAIDSSFYYNFKAIKLNKSLLLLSNIANLHGKNNRIDSMKYYLNEAKIESERKKYPLLQVTVFNRTNGIYLLKKKRYDEAEIYLKEALTMSKKIKRYNAIFTSYKALIDFYEETNNNTKGKYYLTELNRFTDSTETIRANYANFAVEEMLKKKEGEIKQANTNSFRFFLIVCLAIFICLVIVYFYLKSKKTLKSKLNELENKELENIKLRETNDQTYIDLIDAAKKNDNSFMILFEKKYHTFYENLIAKHPNLTKTELVLCALIRLNLSSKEIADYTYVQHKTVQTQKNRLRKKLNIPSDTNLYSFFKNEF